METAEKTVTKTYRLPKSVADIIDAEAKADRRSQNSMMIIILEDWAKQREAKKQ
jgi:hypothetical protein